MAGGIEYSDIQLGMIVLPKTANPEHMKTNAGVDFTISELYLVKNKLRSTGRFRGGEAFFNGS